ncbi:MAG: hypothetical protein A3J04_03075 [Candidatus Ryanbacteria bacterium RIFCSPLOWO2_02_FULL_47_14]|uniref:Uncharacterized protein n=1 Tax=Candidatus Ryanbacteria bacterium RIFCSPLOWO2_02_FULL_47_14 TaxID=1802129 RepID=A0A1G2H477_9BACT|nr:MAG: hypothetical protein A3J04_03075 [Candidatus Ryanbacteria bacterium RIFCSPLOWO2_02_FULL_47_14]
MTKFTKKETEELARMISRAFDDVARKKDITDLRVHVDKRFDEVVAMLRLLPTRGELMGQSHIMRRLDRIEKRLNIAH